METLCVCIHRETWRHSMSNIHMWVIDMETLHVYIHMETWSDTHGDMETLHVHIHMEMWRHTWRHGDSPCPYPHGDTPCLYPHWDMETLHVHIHMETQRHSMSISTWRHRDTPSKICSQIKTNIYDAISSLTLIRPMN